MQTSIFKNHYKDCIIITDTNNEQNGVCLTIFENKRQEIFIHVMVLKDCPKVVKSLASINLNNSVNF